MDQRAIRCAQSTSISEEQMRAIWEMYFPEVEFSAKDPKLLVIKAFVQFFCKDGLELLGEFSLTNTSVQIDFARLIATCPLQDLSLALIDHPEDTIACMSASLTLIQSIVNAGIAPPRYYVEIVNLRPLMPIKSIRSKCIGKYVAIRGTVIRCSKIQPHVQGMTFRCMKCQVDVFVNFINAEFQYPKSCESGCKNAMFQPIREKARTIDSQVIRVQETDSSESEDCSVPKTINCHLFDNLIERCSPGDSIEIGGIVKASPSPSLSSGAQMKKIDANKDSGVHLIYLHANSVRCGKNLKMDELDSLEFNSRDMLAIQTIVKEEDVFALLIQSLCPSIYGLDVIKAGLILSLLGGSQSGTNRDSIHVLIVGDPGLGKSQLLKAVSNISARGVYVCGNTTTKTGLTVSIVKDSEEGAGFEAGALVLADRGVCCIDELDKMPHEQDSLLEAMEQQIVSIAKSGILCSLPARTTVMAASNPIDGHYNHAKTVEENIRMSNALLSRFDLVFLLLDDSNTHRDRLLANHIMKLHKGKTDVASPQKFSASLIEVPDLMYEELLRIRCSRITDALPTLLLRKYLLYARRYIQPVLSSEASQLIKDFYMKKRQNHRVTTRLLLSLIRLCQARAKLDLQKTVSEAHVKEVIDIVEYSFKRDEMEDQSFMAFGSNRRQLGKPKQIQMLLGALKKAVDQKQSPLFTITEIKEVVERFQLPIQDVEEITHLCNEQNYLLQKGPKLFQLYL